MNGGLNTAAYAMRPPPWAFDGDVSDIDYECQCFTAPRTAKRFVEVDDLIMAYRGNVVSVVCDDINYVAPEWCDPQPTPPDVRLSPFAYNGNAYLKLYGGRVGHEFYVTLTVTTSSDVRTQTLHLEIKS